MTDTTNLCMNCMGDTAGGEVCPNCGWNTHEPQMLHALPYGASLQGRYVVGRAQKSNGEGITYIGRDTVQNMTVEIREFFPQSFCRRGENGLAVEAAGGKETVFDNTLTTFLSYAREIAHMRDLSAIVPIFDIFEENGTGYTVSEWDESITLRYFVERSGGNLTWNAARQLFMPVLSALSNLHAAGISHLGISPESLKILQDGKMRLGDFYISSARRMNTEIPPELPAGCAAIEQYSQNVPVGEETDVYGFAASLFFALTGELPKEAIYRREDSRLLIPTELAKALPPHVITALANALQVDPEKRTKTFERLRAELSAAPTVTSTIEQTASITKLPPLPKKKKEEEGLPGFVWLLISCAVTLVIMALIVWIWFQMQSPMGTIEDTGASSSSSAVSSEESGSSASNGVNSSSLQEDSNSSNQEMIEVPNLVDEDYDRILERISASESPEFTVRLADRAFSTTVEEGKIISQEPVSGETMVRGSVIVVVVSQGAPTRELPRVAGLSLAEAAERVTAEGFVPVTEWREDDTIASGNVIGYQDHEAGEQLSYGSQVVLIVSSGTEEESSSSLGFDFFWP